MKQLIVTAVLLFGFNLSAASLIEVDDVNQVAAAYGVPAEKLLQTADIKLEDAAKISVNGPQSIVAVPGQKDTFFLYGSRIIYLKNKPADKVSVAFELTSSMPVPPPVEQIWDRKTEALTENHFITTYGLKASQSKLIVKVTTICKGATHHVAVSAAERLVQNKWIDCVDENDSKKLWYPTGILSSRVVALSPTVTAVLVHNMIVVKRHRVGFITPSKEQIFEMAMKAAEDTLEGFLKRLK